MLVGGESEWAHPTAKSLMLQAYCAIECVNKLPAGLGLAWFVINILMAWRIMLIKLETKAEIPEFVKQHGDGRQIDRGNCWSQRIFRVLAPWLKRQESVLTIPSYGNWNLSIQQPRFSTFGFPTIEDKKSIAEVSTYEGKVNTEKFMAEAYKRVLNCINWT